jgi:hypothetical protein
MPLQALRNRSLLVIFVVDCGCAGRVDPFLAATAQAVRVLPADADTAGCTFLHHDRAVDGSAPDDQLAVETDSLGIPHDIRRLHAGQYGTEAGALRKLRTTAARRGGNTLQITFSSSMWPGWQDAPGGVWRVEANILQCPSQDPR